MLDKRQKGCTDLKYRSSIGYLVKCETKRIMPFLFLFLFLFSTSASALSWAYPFVSWDGRIYEISDDTIEKEQIGKKIGEVEFQPNSENGEYQGNASNFVNVGTPYYQIIGIKTDEAIAIQVDGQYKKSIFKEEQATPPSASAKEFHPMLLISVSIGFIVLCIFFFRSLAKAAKN